MPIDRGQSRKREKELDTSRIRFWELTIKTGILKKEKKLLSTPPDWDAPKIKKILLEIHPTWKNMSLRRLKGRPRP